MFIKNILFSFITVIALMLSFSLSAFDVTITLDENGVGTSSDPNVIVTSSPTRVNDPFFNQATLMYTILAPDPVGTFLPGGLAIMDSPTSASDVINFRVVNGL